MMLRLNVCASHLSSAHSVACACARVSQNMMCACVYVCVLTSEYIVLVVLIGL